VTRTVLLSGILLLLLGATLSQPGSQLAGSCRAAFRQADSLYALGLTVSTETAAGEAREASLNEQSRQRFTSFLQCSARMRDADSFRLVALVKRAELAQYFDDLPAALADYHTATALRSGPHHLPDSCFFKPLLFAGIIHYRQGALDSAASCLEQAAAIQDSYAVPLEEAGRLYNNLGALRYESGNYRSASLYFQKALDLLQPSHPYYRSLAVNYKINLAAIQVRLRQYDEADAIYQSLIAFNEHGSEIDHNRGLIRLRTGRPAEAMRFFSRVRYGNLSDAGLANDMASACIDLHRYDSAHAFLDSATARNNRYGSGATGGQRGITDKLRGDIDVATGNAARALRHYQEAIIALYPAFRDTSVHANPRTFTNAFTYIHLFDALVAKAEAFHRLYETSHAGADGDGELDAYTAAFKLLAYTSQTYDSDEARLFLEQSKYRVHGRPIDIALALFRQTKKRDYLETAYRFDQETKASVLAFNEMQNARIDPADPLLREERNLREAITRLSLAASRMPDSTGRRQLASTITDKEIALGRIQKALGEKYTTSSAEIPPVRTLQHLLDDRTALLSYHLDGGNLTVFTLTANTLTGTQQRLPVSFGSDLAGTIASLHGGEAIRDPAAEARLYAILIGSHGIDAYERLIVIPDDELLYLPFETLWDGNRYLVEKASVQYQYSTALLKKETAGFAKASTVSFAPFAGSGAEGFERLPHSLDEVRGVGGNILSDGRATKDAFLKTIDRYDVVHLATHAVASDSSDQLSFIAFAGGGGTDSGGHLLYAPEIANLSLGQNKLIVLSACETGSGRLIRGEGVMSLSRAFASAGCADIVTSLWKADDEATAFLCQEFHGNLRNGLTIDEALAEAKRAYLSSPRIHPRKKAPSFWAHLVFVGNYEPQPAHQRWTWILGVAILLAATLFLWRKRRKRSA
jgi:tetratricopeptide (TPR) repeat protein